MHRIALINPVVPGKARFVPTGLCYLSAYIKKHAPGEVDVRIFDTPGRSIERVVDYGPHIAGFTSLTHTLNSVCGAAADLKSTRPDVHVVLGGQHLSMAPWSMPEAFDWGVLGEGEESFLRLVRVLLSGQDVDPGTLNGVQYWRDGRLESLPRLPPIEPLDSIPFPDRENVEHLEEIITCDHPAWFNRTGLRSMQLTTSRGCPYQCVFCQPSALWGRYRMHSAEYVAEEIRHIHSRFGINAILVEDDLFTQSKARIAELVERLGRAGLLGEMVYYVAARAFQIDREWLELFRELGVVKVELGIESGSDRVAKYLKKGRASTEINRNAIRLLNAENISVAASFMAGSPPEEMDDLRQTFEMMTWIRKGHKHNSCSISIATPLPGTGLWDYATNAGLIDPDHFDWDRLARSGIPSDETRMVYLNSHIPARKLLRAVRRMNLRLLVGTPRVFLSAVPRRCRRLVQRIGSRPVGASACGPSAKGV